MQFGVQTIPGGWTLEELRHHWQEIEQAGFDLITVPDHIAPIRTSAHQPVYEGAALHLLLAVTTSRVTCGNLVYCAAFRPIGVLARALATISAACAGRIFAGIGAGWWADDFAMWGLPFDSPAVRSDAVEETVRVLRQLLAGESVSFEGTHVSVRDACSPSGIRGAVPIWVAGNGQRRTLPTAAKWADGWNSPFAGPDEFARLNRALDELCADAGRAPGAVGRSVNVRLAWDSATADRVRAEMRPGAHAAILSGGAQQMIDMVAQYAAAGADAIVIDVRHPQPVEDVLRFAVDVAAPFASGRW